MRYHLNMALYCLSQKVSFSERPRWQSILRTPTKSIVVVTTCVTPSVLSLLSLFESNLSSNVRPGGNAFFAACFGSLYLRCIHLLKDIVNNFRCQVQDKNPEVIRGVSREAFRAMIMKCLRCA